MQKTGHGKVTEPSPGALEALPTGATISFSKRPLRSHIKQLSQVAFKSFTYALKPCPD